MIINKMGGFWVFLASVLCFAEHGGRFAAPDAP